jgi:ribosomal protein S18 acetylase RimI-like enzyme
VLRLTVEAAVPDARASRVNTTAGKLRFPAWPSTNKMTAMSAESPVEIFRADLADPRHAQWIVELTDIYSRDILGNGQPLPAHVLEELVPGLRAQPTTVVFLAATAGPESVPVGIATCFGGFSTFAARPLINIHDIFVDHAFRNRGIAKRLIQAVEDHARASDCCKLTLEVLENNYPARHVYKKAGFAQAVYQEDAGGALFYAKPL